MSASAGPNERDTRSSIDDVLVTAAIKGDLISFEALVRRHQRAVLAVGRRMSGSPEDAKDIAQATFMKAFVGLPGFQGRSSFSTWLTSIARNESLMWKRKRAREIPISNFNADPDSAEPIEIADPQPDPESILAEKERSDLLRAKINRLNPIIRVAVQLSDLNEESTEATALWLGITVAAVKSRRSRGRAALRRALTLGSTRM